MPPVPQILNEAAVVDLDSSFIIQLLIFLGLLVILRKLVFGPYLKTIEAREDRTAKARTEADEISSRAVSLEARFESEMAKARARAADAKNALRLEGMKRREALVGEARSAANKELEAVDARVEHEVATARQQMAPQVKEISRQMAEKLLGRAA